MNEKNRFANATHDAESFGELAMSDTALESLFSSARGSMPSLQSDNFTKVVLNSLPETPLRRKSASVSFELIGVLAGLIAAYFVIDFNALVRGFIAMVPNSITLSPLHMLIALGSISVMSVAAWWAVERGR